MSSQDNHLYEFGPYVIDARSRILLKDGTTVRLTPKAFDTLFVLVRHASQVVEKEQLLREVWPDIFVEEGSLSHNIHGLRKALGDDSSEPRYIETIPKRGYRFVAPVKVSEAKISQPETAQIDFGSGLDEDAVVIEKHTFARVITDEVDEPEAPVEVRDAQRQPAPTWPTATTKALPSAVVTNRRKKRAIWVAVAGAALAVSAICGFVYTTRAPVIAPPVTRAKSTLVRLTNNNAMDCEPAWSPDGSRMAFWSNRDGGKEIYVMDANGSNVKRLTNNLADDVNPTWSPDGLKILYESDRDAATEMCGRHPQNTDPDLERGATASRLTPAACRVHTESDLRIVCPGGHCSFGVSVVSTRAMSSFSRPISSASAVLPAAVSVIQVRPRRPA
jgi:DNA-binding winged helix-turn-helix (wHTH) protein